MGIKVNCRIFAFCHDNPLDVFSLQQLICCGLVENNSVEYNFSHFLCYSISSFLSIRVHCRISAFCPASPYRCLFFSAVDML